MPFNKDGEWQNLDPLATYEDFVKKSETNPGGGSDAWTSGHRNELHNQATRYVMERDGIKNTEENFKKTREEIARRLEEDYDYNERNHLEEPQAGLNPIRLRDSESPSIRFYGKREGD